MSNSIDIPSDVWGEILVRLPAECLIRSRAVCKGWRAVIDDENFVRTHTNKHHQQQQLSSSNIILESEASCYSLDLEALINSCSSSNCGHQAVAATPLEDSPAGLWSSPVATCNGLVLTEKPLTIWNPLTHERLELPRARGFKTKKVRAIGLGYDGTTDVYKAVVVLTSRQTHVYSLKPGCSWRRIINCPGDSRGSPFGPGVFVCGVLNWLTVSKLGAYEDKIVALDLGAEKFSRLLQMPRLNKGGLHPPGMLLNVLSGCLALCDSCYRISFDVWVMKVYGDEDSWIKLFSIDSSRMWTNFLRPVAFILREKFVFLQDTSGCFFIYDVENKSLKRLGIRREYSSLEYSPSLEAKQMFVGNIFRLHANCGGVFRKKATSCTKKKKKSAEDVELVLFIRDANGTRNVSCSERGCRLFPENKDDGT